MGIRDRLRAAVNSTGLFEPGQTSTAEPSTPPPPAGPSVSVPQRWAKLPQPSPVPTWAPPTQPAGAAPDPEIVEDLRKSVVASKVVGYAQFRVIYDSMAGLPDPQRLQMALTVAAATQKVSSADILDGLEDRLAIVAEQRRQFDETYQQEYQSAVKSKQDELTAKQVQLQQLATQIQELTVQITTTQSKLEEERAKFEASAIIIVQELQAEQQRIAGLVSPPLKG